MVFRVTMNTHKKASFISHNQPTSYRPARLLLWPCAAAPTSVSHTRRTRGARAWRLMGENKDKNARQSVSERETAGNICGEQIMCLEHLDRHCRHQRCSPARHWKTKAALNRHHMRRCCCDSERAMRQTHCVTAEHSGRQRRALGSHLE